MPTQSSDNPAAEASSQSPPGGLDYDIADEVEVSSPEQLKAIADETRRIILDLLLDRAATTTHIAEALDKPKGTVGYHLKVLEAAGLIHVVRTAQVRAMTEKYYGRVGRTVLIKGSYGSSTHALPMLDEAAHEARIVNPDDPLPMATLRHIRIPEERAVEFAKRLYALSDEFVSQPRGGDTVYGFVAAVYPTDHPSLRDPDPTEQQDRA